jgi:predicted RND superfamily exporter protein
MDAMPVVRDRADFDEGSGGRVERLVFKHRPTVVAASAVLTIVLAWAGATRHVVNADFEDLAPAHHPFTRHSREHRSELRGLGNSLRIAVENTRGDVYDPEYLDALRRITDELVLLPGVDRAWVKSLWMPSVRWSEVTEEGFRGGPVMPDDYDGSPRAVAALRRNLERAGVAGSLVAHDGRSSLVFVPLIDRDPVTGEGLDYRTFSRRLEELRARFEGGGTGVAVHVVGFAKLVGDLLQGVVQVAAFFALAAAIVSGVLFLYTRCLRGTAVVVACSAVAVVWQVGLVSALGVPLDPFSVLVPYLVFAMGVSHGAQKMNGVLRDVGRGTHRLVAARYTFRRLFLAGLTALLTDAVAFAVLALVDVPAIQRVAVAATLGATVLVFTNLVLVPVLLSYTGVSPAAAARSLGAADGARGEAAWRFLERFAGRRWAAGALAVFAILLGVAAVHAGGGARIGDLDPGAPELRPSSRYNRDDAFIAANYDVSNDVFAVIVRTPEDGCLAYRTLVEADGLGWALRQLPGVRSTTSLADAVRRLTAGSFEGSPKWLTIPRDQEVLNHVAQQAIARNPDLSNVECSVMPVIAYLADHRSETLDGAVRVAEEFARRHGDATREFLLAAGSAGMEAATHAAVRDATWRMTLLVYGAVVLLGFATLRSWRAVATMVIPLAVTAVLCEAVMVLMGIGVKLDTLPVISLGVGIPDYALYLLAVQLPHQRAGLPLREAYGRALRFTGKVVVLIACTLAGAVVTWSVSPIKLQADMGLLLTFMFLANMGAALVLVPALSHFLLSRPEPARARRPPHG